MENYLEERVTKQREWYETKANENKKTFISYQTVIIILGAVIPVLVTCESIVPFLKLYGGQITAVISAVISVIAGLDKLKQPQPNWFNYRANEEAIKKEEWFYRYKAGPYKKLQANDAQILFVERIESIISADIARMTSSNDKKDEDNGTENQNQPQSENGIKPESAPA